MLKKRTYSAILFLAVIAFPAAATAAGRGGGEPPRIGLAAAVQVNASPLTEPVTSFHRAIRVELQRIRAARRARQRSQRRRHREAFTSLPAGVSMATLDAIAACESGGNPTAVSANGLYRGKYQFDYGTWASVGGSGDPAAAPEAEQDYRAALLYARAGPSPWPVCG